jgi:hypothetical protein
MYRNEEGLDPNPILNGFPKDHWVLEFSGALDDGRISQFLADERATLIESP